jgi:16S rRNA C967 or C1407 C5-methylase (RsmB/RsmF family)
MDSSEVFQSRKRIPDRFSADVVALTREVFGTEADNVLSSLGQPVKRYYVRCNTLKAPISQLKEVLSNDGLRVESHPLVPEALWLPVDGPFEIALSENTVVVDKHTAESVLQGANVYAPGVRNCGSMQIGDRISILTEFGEPIATGKAAMSANDVLTFRKGLAIQVEDRKFVGPHIRELAQYNQGLLYPQSLAAMVTTRVLDPQSGETVVDMNCAPGGKLSHISQLMGNSGNVYGFDRNAQKIKQTRNNVTRLGCTNVVLSIHDSRYLHDDLPNLEADRVLIDPPCSALGLRPKVYDITTREKVDSLSNYQKQFLTSAKKITKPGGTIVYSVCTFTIQECEQIVDFAEHECGLKVVKQEPFVGSEGLSTLTSSGALCQRFHPQRDEIGYFIAKFIA